jgi:hypothetical protein
LSSNSRKANTAENAISAAKAAMTFGGEQPLEQRVAQPVQA